MKKIFQVLLVVLTTGVSAQNNDYLLSLDGIGSIKLEMTQAELEKVLRKKIPITNLRDTASGVNANSAKIKYKNIIIELDFTPRYSDNTTFVMTISGIRTNSPLCKTKSGIGIGTDKLKIVTSYEQEYLVIRPGFSKTQSSITIQRDFDKHMLVFLLNNKKVVGFEVTKYTSDSE